MLTDNTQTLQGYVFHMSEILRSATLNLFILIFTQIVMYTRQEKRWHCVWKTKCQLYKMINSRTWRHVVMWRPQAALGVILPCHAIIQSQNNWLVILIRMTNLIGGSYFVTVYMCHGIITESDSLLSTLGTSILFTINKII